MTGFLIFLLPFLTWAQGTTMANIHELNTKEEKKLFTLSIEIKEKEDGVHTLAVFRDLQGKEVISEKGHLQGAKILSYEINQGQTQEKGRFKVEGDKIRFEYEGPNGKKKEAEEKLNGFILSTANFNAFVKENWQTLASGKEMDVRFAVWDRLETVGFTLKKVREASEGANKWIELRMKPTSFVIAALVDPIFLLYSTTDQSLLQMKGRVAPKQFKDGKWKDLDAKVLYTSANTVSK
ncbi:hypothetical protein ACES2L_08750 [Bdellovibrio bacteriovorus]